jgi:hypothetical protein
MCSRVVSKNYLSQDPRWSLVEEMPLVCLERILEGHELVCQELSMWPPLERRRFVLREERDKYGLFLQPEVSHSCMGPA